MAKTAGIILIGNEILSGKVADANAAYLCEELRALGVNVRRITVIPDEVELIGKEVSELAQTYDYVFTSGGVGPTHDDVTIEGIARGLGVAVVRHPELAARLKGLYQERLNKARLKMAEVPEGAELLAKDLYFPAVVIRNIYVLPGIPEIFREKFQAIKERFRDRPFHLRSIYVRIGEGVLAAYLTYYHGSRTHLSLEKDAPRPRRVQHVSEGAVIAFPEVGGLHHRYERRAA